MAISIVNNMFLYHNIENTFSYSEVFYIILISLFLHSRENRTQEYLQ